MARFVPTKELVGMDAPVLDESTARMVAVKNVPVVGDEKFEKLCTVMKKVMGRAGELADHEYAFFMPKGEDGKTKGVVFVEYGDVKGAKAAVEKLNGMKLDSAHLLEVIPLAQFDETRDLPEAFVAPEQAPFVPREESYEWLESAEMVRGCEMYATWISSETTIAKFNPKEPKEPTVVHHAVGFSLPSFSWSPSGSYFVTMHPQGAMVFPVGADGIAATPKLKMAMPGVAHVDFSPRERYALLRTASADSAVVLYDVQGEKVMVKFAPGPEPFAWDAEERFCARLAPKNHVRGREGAIEVFNTAKRTLSYVPVPGLSVLAMSPRGGLAACFTPEAENRGASIALVDVETGRLVRAHTVCKALSCTFHWQADGRYLAAVVDTHAKHKLRVSALTLFRVAERGCPVEHIDEPARHIAQLAWEPGYGTHFAYVSTEPADPAARRDDAQDLVQAPLRKACVSVYDMRAAGAKAARVTVIPDKRASLLSWAPQQGVLLICDLLTSNGAIEFYSLACAQSIATVQHFNAKHVCWDPSGRFVAVVSPAGGRNGDAGYELFTFTGKLVEKVTKMGFEQFVWRPRPPCALSPAEVQNIRKNLNKYRAEFQLDEKREREERQRAANEKLLAKSRAFQGIMAKLLAAYDAEAEQRLALTGGFNPTDPDRFIVEETVTQTVLSKGK